MIAVGLFADNPIPLGTTSGRSGLFKGGGWYLLGIQTLSALCLTCWGISSTFLLLWVIDKIIPIRMDPNEELLGADLMEHRIRHSRIGLSRAISALSPLKIDLNEVAGISPIGQNPGHENMLDEIQLANKKLNHWYSYMDQATPKKTNRFNNIFKSIKLPIGQKNLNRVTTPELSGTGKYKKNENIPSTSDTKIKTVSNNDTVPKPEAVSGFAWIE